MERKKGEAPLEEVRRWKRVVSKKIARMKADEELKYFKRNNKKKLIA